MRKACALSFERATPPLIDGLGACVRVYTSARCGLAYLHIRTLQLRGPRPGVVGFVSRRHVADVAHAAGGSSSGGSLFTRHARICPNTRVVGRDTMQGGMKRHQEHHRDYTRITPGLHAHSQDLSQD